MVAVLGDVGCCWWCGCCGRAYGLVCWVGVGVVVVAGGGWGDVVGCWLGVWGGVLVYGVGWWLVLLVNGGPVGFFI